MTTLTLTMESGDKLTINLAIGPGGLAILENSRIVRLQIEVDPLLPQKRTIADLKL